VARAKRTDRADARRRYRATQAPVAEPDGDTAGARNAATAAVPVSGGGPLGLLSGVHMPDFRGDLVAMPEVVRTTPILLVAFALGIFAVVAGLVFPLNDPGLSSLVLPLFIQAPGIPVLVGGFLAPRGAWLVGGVMGLLQALGLLAAIYRSTPAAIDTSQVAVALISGVVLGVVFGGLAAWYRRWLRTMSARNAAARTEREKQQRRDSKRSARPAR
jgi:hypothetical protein